MKLDVVPYQKTVLFNVQCRQNQIPHNNVIDFISVQQICIFHTNIILYGQTFRRCNALFCFISRSASPSKMCAKLVIAGIWVISAALAAPMAIALRVTLIENGWEGMKPFCHNVRLSEDAMLAYRVVLLVLQYLTPLCVISCVYIRMALTLWGSKTPGNAKSTRDATLMKNKKKVCSAFHMKL